MARKTTPPALTRPKAVAVRPNPHAALVERIRSVTGALCAAPSPHKRQALVDELEALTRVLADLPPLH